MSLTTVMTPKEIVVELNKYIIGQEAAKRAVAIALRNRWRRQQLKDELRQEIYPKNILMIGPTGVGKTEIARRLSSLAKAPFIKVEATKFTEVGYVGRDVEQIIRDLVEVAVKMIRERAVKKVKVRADERAVERVLNVLCPTTTPKPGEEANVDPNEPKKRQALKEKLLAGELNDQEIDIHVSPNLGIEIMTPHHGMEQMANQLQSLFQNVLSDRKQQRKLKVEDALKQLSEEESMNMVNEEDIQSQAVTTVEQNGIVFIDEIDKVVRRGEYGGADVSREGVQRDLLPLVEGCTVFTKYGMIKTDHILFIASGAFHLSKPSDLVPELQGRLPIRVELEALKKEDFFKILTEPSFSLTKQYIALLDTEGVTLNFTKQGIERLADLAYQVNERTENIGARRLYTIMERLLESISFSAPENDGETIRIDKTYVDKHLATLVKNDDLSQYIL